MSEKAAKELRHVPLIDRLARGSFIAGVTVALLLGLGELIVRVAPVKALARSKVEALELELENARIQPHPYLAYIPKPNFRSKPEIRDKADYAHNSLGFHSPEITQQKPPGTFRIFCLGGSSTYCQTESSTAKGWPNRLQVLLREQNPGLPVEVINGGCQGYSTFESLANLSFRGLSLSPDLVLVYHAINDMRCALYPGVNADNTHWRVNWPVERNDGIERLFEKSYLYKVVRRYSGDWYKNRSNLGGWVIRDFGKYTAEFGDDFNQPTGEQGFANFQRNLTSIVSIARAHGAEITFVTQAMWLPHIRGAKSYELQKAGLARIRDLTFTVAKDRDVTVIDAAPEIEAAAVAQYQASLARATTDEEKKNASQTLIRNEVHFSDEGSEMLAQILAKELVQRGLVPR